MVERGFGEELPLSQRMVKSWYTDFALRAGATASSVVVITEANNNSLVSNLIGVGVSFSLWLGTRVTSHRMQREVSAEITRKKVSGAKQQLIFTEMNELYIPRLMAGVSGGMGAFAYEAPPSYPTIFLGLAAVGVALDGEERLAAIGKKVVKALKGPDDGPHPVFEYHR